MEAGSIKRKEQSNENGMVLGPWSLEVLIGSLVKLMTDSG